MKKIYFNYLIYVGILIIFATLIFKKAPTVYNNYISENSKLETTAIRRLSGDEILVPNIKQNKVILFWATWCGVCHVEMRKLNEMISRGDLKPEDLIAISLDENREDVINFVEKENYQFLIAHDFDGSLARKFKISATPTIMFINKNSKIDWASTGMSLTLEKRVKDFLKY